MWFVMTRTHPLPSLYPLQDMRPEEAMSLLIHPHRLLGTRKRAEALSHQLHFLYRAETRT